MSRSSPPHSGRLDKCVLKRPFTLSKIQLPAEPLRNLTSLSPHRTSNARPPDSVAFFIVRCVALRKLSLASVIRGTVDGLLVEFPFPPFLFCRPMAHLISDI